MKTSLIKAALAAALITGSTATWRRAGVEF
jgi:hypothetical protein